MKEGQDIFYYVIVDSLQVVKFSFYLEIFCKKGIEVLLMGECIDEWLMFYFIEFSEKQFVFIVKVNLDLGDFEDEEFKKVKEEVEKEVEGLFE